MSQGDVVSTSMAYVCTLLTTFCWKPVAEESCYPTVGHRIPSSKYLDSIQTLPFLPNSLSSMGTYPSAHPRSSVPRARPPHTQHLERRGTRVNVRYSIARTEVKCRGLKTEEEFWPGLRGGDVGSRGRGSAVKRLRLD